MNRSPGLVFGGPFRCRRPRRYAGLLQFPPFAIRPPSMRGEVKPRRHIICRGADRPRCRLRANFRRFPAFLHSIFSPPPHSPHPTWGRAAAEKKCCALHYPLPTASSPEPYGSKRCGRLACVAVRAPGPNDRLSVWNQPRSHAPCTVYASSVRHATNKSLPIERTVPSQVHPAAQRRLSPTSLSPPR